MGQEEEGSSAYNEENIEYECGSVNFHVQHVVDGASGRLHQLESFGRMGVFPCSIPRICIVFEHNTKKWRGETQICVVRNIERMETSGIRKFFEKADKTWFSKQSKCNPMGRVAENIEITVPPNAFSGSSSNSTPVVAVRSVLKPASAIPATPAIRMHNQRCVPKYASGTRQIVALDPSTRKKERKRTGRRPKRSSKRPIATELSASIAPKLAIVYPTRFESPTSFVKLPALYAWDKPEYTIARIINWKRRFANILKMPKKRSSTPPLLFFPSPSDFEEDLGGSRRTRKEATATAAMEAKMMKSLRAGATSFSG